MEVLVFIWLAVTGLALGSFVNAYVYRIYQSEFASRKKRKKLSIINGRSQCPSCNHQLAAKDLLPVISWLLLKGKCRYCNSRISAQYPLVELAGMFAVIVSYVVWPFGFNTYAVALFILWLATITICLALTVADFRWMLLPNKMIYPLAGIAFTWAVVQAMGTGELALLLWSLASGVLLGGFFHVIYLVSDGTWIGGGDVRIGYVLGVFSGSPMNVFILLFLSSILALCAFIASGLVLRRKNKLIPYGPFLIVATAIIVLSRPSLERIISQLLLL